MKKIIPGSVEQLEIQVRQLTIQRDTAQAAVKQMEGVIRGHSIRRLRMYDSLMIEKLDLLGRIARIDQRIGALDLKPAMTAGSSITLDGLSELGSDNR